MITKPDLHKLNIIRTFYAEYGILPSYRKIARMVGYKSSNASYKLINRFIESGHLKRLEGQLAPDNLYND